MKLSESSRSKFHSFHDKPEPTFHQQSRSSMVLFTDLISGIDEASRYEVLLPKSKSYRSKPCFYICPNPRLWLILTFLSIVCLCIATSLDFICLCLTEARKKFITDQNTAVQLIIWIGYSLSFAFIAASCGKYISKEAEGSGIPEMKAIINGATIKEYISYQTLSSKIVGLIAATASGLSMGREGPFVHISCIIADKISGIPLFKIPKDSAIHKQLLATAAAVGVGMTFGSPMGGVLFSIEIASTYYNVSNLWKSLYASTACCLLFKLIGLDDLTNLITSRHYASVSFEERVIPFIVLGICAGVLGSLFVYTVGKITHLKRTYPEYWLSNRYVYTLLACTVCSLVVFFFDVMKNSDRVTIHYMFQPELLGQTIGSNAKMQLGIYSLAKLVMTVISITCPVPCGVFTPVFALGAVLGRLYGEVFYHYINVHPGVCALVGAAALTSSVTHTLSVILIVFELSGQISYLPFMLVGVFSSYAVTTLLSSSIYDLLITLKKIPYIASIRDTEIYAMHASDIMAIAHSLHSVVSMRKMWKTLICNISILEVVPIVDSSGFIIGEVPIRKIIEFIREEYLKIREKLMFPQNYDNYFRILETVFIEKAANVDFQKLEMLMNQFTNKDNLGEEIIGKFLKKKIVIATALEMELSPLTVTEDSPVSKVHYLFVILGVLQIYVTNRGQITGVITRKHFLDIN